MNIGRLLLLWVCLPAYAQQPDWLVLDFSWDSANTHTLELPGLDTHLELSRPRSRVLLRPGPTCQVARIGRGPLVFHRLASPPETRFSAGWHKVLDGSVFAVRCPDVTGRILVSLHAEGGRLSLARAPSPEGFLPGPQGLRATPQGDSLELSWDRDPGAQAYAVYRLPEWGAAPELLLRCEAPTCVLPTSDALMRLAVASIGPQGESLPTPITLTGPTAAFRYGSFRLGSQQGFRFADGVRLSFDEGYGDLRLWDLDEMSVHGYLTRGGALDQLLPLGSFAYLPWEVSERGLSLETQTTHFFARIGDRALAEIGLLAVEADSLHFEFVYAELDLELRLQILGRLAGPLDDRSAARVPELIEQLSDPEHEMRDAAQQALFACGLDVVPLLAAAWYEGVDVEAGHRLRAVIEALWNR